MHRMCCLQIVSCASARPVCVVLTTSKVAKSLNGQSLTNMAVIIIVPLTALSVTRPLPLPPSLHRYYRRQAFLVHPDKNKTAGAEEAFKVLGHAFEEVGESVSGGVDTVRSNKLLNEKYY